MLETPHALVGAAIATKIPDPFVAIPLAFASHFLLDMVPHWNPHLNTEIKNYGSITSNSTVLVALDVLIALILGTFIAINFSANLTHLITILLGAFAAVLPDVVEGPYFFLNWKSKAIKKWLMFQKSIQADTTPLPGLMTQLATIICALWWIAS